MRRLPSIDALIPALYLRGVSTGDFSEALESILGPNASGLSATNVVRLKEIWKQDYAQWEKRDLSQKKYVYVWADGIHFNVRLDDERTCILVLIGTTQDGKKELLAIHDGYRESKLSWKELLRDLKARGLSHEPALAVGDGALGFWAALREEFPSAKEQRCWVHKTANILDKMPKGVQSKAKKRIHNIYMAETKEHRILGTTSDSDVDDGLQARRCCRETLAKTEQTEARHESHRGSKVRRRRDGRGCLA